MATPKRRSLRERNLEAIADAPTPLRPVPEPREATSTTTAPTPTTHPSPSSSPSSPPSPGPGAAGRGAGSDQAGEGPARAGRPAPSGRRRGVRKGRDGAAQAVKAGATGTAVARILYLPEDLLEPMRVYRGAEGVTNTQLALRALNAHWRHIDELAARESSTRVVPGELFDEVLPTVRQARRQVEITPTGAQLEVIETTLAGTTARDRSHMFALAIRQLLTDAGVITPAT